MPELKRSICSRLNGLPLEERLLAGLRHDSVRLCPLVIQSFESANLRYLRTLLGQRPQLRLMQLIDPTGRPADTVQSG